VTTPTTAQSAAATTTTATKRAVAGWLAREVRRYRALIGLWLVYEASRLAFFYLSRRHGLLQGVSVVSFGVLAFGAWVLVLRLAVLFFLPVAVVSRVAQRLWLGAPTAHSLRTQRAKPCKPGI
jgi:hypothetical protein